MQFIINKNSIFVSNEGESYTVDSSYPSFEKIKEYIKLGNWFAAKKLIDIGNAITEFGDGIITVQRGVVKFKDYVVDNSLTRRIVRMIGEEVDSTPIINFLMNLMENPDKRAVDETYGFLDHNDLPITPDGCFMAYKNVNEDYLDKHSRTFSNKVGDICEMPRNMVCSDKQRTCSSGLHFCSLEYLQGFWGTSGHTMLIKINPRDVVSIPVDYKGAKGRCSRYEVVAEADFSDGVTEVFTETVYGKSEKSEREPDFIIRKGSVWEDENGRQFFVRGYKRGVPNTVRIEYLGDKEGDTDWMFLPKDYEKAQDFYPFSKLIKSTGGEILCRLAKD